MFFLNPNNTLNVSYHAFGHIPDTAFGYVPPSFFWCVEWTKYQWLLTQEALSHAAYSLAPISPAANASVFNTASASGASKS